MRFSVLVEIVLRVEDLVAEIADVGFLFGIVLTHVSEKLVERREIQIAETAVRRMIVTVSPQVRRKVVLLIEAFIAEGTLEWLLSRMRSLKIIFGL